jgi:cbb3-type cytochrome oxidase subunit 3
MPAATAGTAMLALALVLVIALIVRPHQRAAAALAR